MRLPKTLIPGTQTQDGKTYMSTQPADSSKQVGVIGTGFREKGTPASPLEKPFQVILAQAGLLQFA